VRVSCAILKNRLKSAHLGLDPATEFSPALEHNWRTYHNCERSVVTERVAACITEIPLVPARSKKTPHVDAPIHVGIKVISTQIRVYSHSNIVDVFLCIPKIHAYFAVFRAD
jgi:hypothetical protein